MLKSFFKYFSGVAWLGLFVWFVLMVPTCLHAAVQLEFRWDPNTEPDIAGYRIYSHQENQDYNYAEPVWEGSETSCTISISDEETILYFVVRAYDTEGFESQDSNEATYINTGLSPDDFVSDESPESDQDAALSERPATNTGSITSNSQTLIEESAQTSDIPLDNPADITLPGDVIALNTITGQGQVYVYKDECPGVRRINRFVCMGTDDMSGNGPMPNLSLGLFHIQLLLENMGDTVWVSIYFSFPADEDARWYTYDRTNGWQDYSGHSTFSDDGMSVVLRFKDGGFGDADGIENGVIVSKSGLGDAPHSFYGTQLLPAPDDPDSVGGGCFIDTGSAVAD